MLTEVAIIFVLERVPMRQIAGTLNSANSFQFVQTCFRARNFFPSSTLKNVFTEHPVQVRHRLSCRLQHLLSPPRLQGNQGLVLQQKSAAAHRRDVPHRGSSEHHSLRRSHFRFEQIDGHVDYLLLFPLGVRLRFRGIDWENSGLDSDYPRYPNSATNDRHRCLVSWARKWPLPDRSP